MLDFNEETHEYTLDGKKLISVTQLMQKQGLSPDYSKVDSRVLNAKAERGSLIHKEIEDYNKNGEIGFSEELTQYIDYLEANNVKCIESEQKVFNDVVAGTLDLLLLSQNDETIIADIKTTSTLHKDSVSWQLSIYAYLLGEKVDRGQAFHFDSEGKLHVVDIPLKPREEIERLMECERTDSPFYQLVPIDENQLAIISKAQSIIENAKKMKDEADKMISEVNEAVMKAMAENGVKTYEDDKIRITLVDPYEKTTFDSKKFKEDHADMYDNYIKKSKVKASLKITLKGEK